MKAGTRFAILFLLVVPAAPLWANVDYQTQVFPILRENCFECHGGPDAKKDIRMDIAAKFQEHIHEEGYIIPGKPEDSRLLELLKLDPDDEWRMPRPGPNNRQPLDPREIAIIEEWIAEGASFEKQDGIIKAPMPGETTLDKTALQTWTSSSGTEIKAYFVRVEGANIVLRSEDGQEKPFAATIFSEESIELARQLAALDAPAP